MTQRATTKNICTIGFGNAASQAILVLTIPFITRMYSPESYAKWALYMSVVAIVGAVSTLRYELAIVLPKNSVDALNIFATACLLSLLTAFLTAFFLIIIKGYIVSLFAADNFLSGIVGVSLLVALGGVYQSTTHWFTRQQSFGVLALLPFSSSVITCLSQIVLAIVGYGGFGGLVVGSILGMGMTTGMAIILFFYRERTHFVASVSPRRMWLLAKKYRNYPCYITSYTLVGVVRERIILFLINSIGSQATVGFFALANRLVNLPVGLISGSLRPVLFQRAAVADYHQIQSFMDRTLVNMARFATPFWILLLFCATEFFTLVFGEQWRGAGAYAVILSFAGFTFLFTDWSDRLLDVLGRQKLAFQMEFYFSLSSIAVLFVSLLVTRNLFICVASQSFVLMIFHFYWLYTVYRCAGFRMAGLLRALKVIFASCSVWTVLAGVLKGQMPLMAAIACYLLIVAGYFIYLMRQGVWVDQQSPEQLSSSDQRRRSLG